MSKEFCTSARKRASPSCRMSVLRRSRGDRSKGPERKTTPASPLCAGDCYVVQYSTNAPCKARARRMRKLWRVTMIYELRRIMICLYCILWNNSSAKSAQAFSRDQLGMTPGSRYPIRQPGGLTHAPRCVSRYVTIDRAFRYNPEVTPSP